MILIDTSVMIDYLKGKDNAKTQLLDEVIRRDIPYGFSAYTYQEILQGARDEKEFNTLKVYFSTQKIYFLPNRIRVFEVAAEFFFFLRRKGKTVRSTIDILIALTAIDNNLSLLHNDRDFDIMAEEVSELKILTALTY